jgi:hypothetical protein
MNAAGRRAGGARRAPLAAIAAACLGAAAAGLVGGPRAQAAGPLTGGARPLAARTASDSTPTTPSCPTANPPNELVLAGGTPQTAQLGAAFATALAVTLANTDGCPLSPTPAGAAITFTAPASGASAVFPQTDAHAVTVGSDPSGGASTTVDAGTTPGSYAILASSAYGAVSFTLANTAAGLPAALVPVGAVDDSATVGKAYPHRLSVRVLDATGAPVPGVAIAFSLGASAPDGPGASFPSGDAQATATTNSLGAAVSPRLRADRVAGEVTATATLVGASAGGAAGGGNAGTATTLAATVDFHLYAQAGAPATITAGAAADAQSTPVDTRFPIPLAVTVTDADGNPVPDTPVTFTAPAHGPSGSFAATVAVGVHTTRRRRAAVRVIRVATNRAGIAVAPAFRTDDRPGGYIVTAVAGHARPAAFALVNAAPGPPT